MGEWSRRGGSVRVHKHVGVEVERGEREDERTRESTRGRETDRGNSMLYKVREEHLARCIT